MSDKPVITLHAPSTHVSRLNLVLRDLRNLGMEPIVVSYSAFGDRPVPTAVGPNDQSYHGNGQWGKAELLRWIDEGFTLFSHEEKTTGQRMLVRVLDDWVFVVFGQLYYRYEGEDDRWRVLSRYNTRIPEMEEVTQKYLFAALPTVDFRAAMSQKRSERGQNATVGMWARSHLSHLLGLEIGVEATLPSTMLETWPEVVQSIGWDGSGHSREEST